jgi:hypothetical protein
MIELLLDIGSPAGSALVVFILLSRKIDSIKSCVNEKFTHNVKEISYIKGKLGLN